MKNSEKHFGTSLLASVAIAVSASFLLYSPSPQAAPSIAWEPSRVKASLTKGEEAILTVSLMANESIDSLSLTISPNLQPYLTVSPSQLHNLAKEQTISLELTISAQEEDDRQSLSGILQAIISQQGNILSFPLPIQIVMHSNHFGITLDVPSEFTKTKGNEPHESHIVEYVNSEDPYQGILIDWYEGNPENLEIEVWADGEEWPFDDHWSNHYQVNYISNQKVLQHNESGSVIFSLRNRIYYITNGIAPDSTFIDLNTFNKIIESMEAI